MSRETDLAHFRRHATLREWRMMKRLGAKYGYPCGGWGNYVITYPERINTRIKWCLSVSKSMRPFPRNYNGIIPDESALYQYAIDTIIESFSEIKEEASPCKRKLP
jgi:hypothetical protein